MNRFDAFEKTMINSSRESILVAIKMTIENQLEFQARIQAFKTKMESELPIEEKDC